MERDGVRTFYEVYGDGDPTVLLVPTWALVHSRVWKCQIPYLARHFRVVTFDARGNGRSDRPGSVEAYSEWEYAADTLAVLDMTGTEQAAVVTLSIGAQRALILAAEHRERVAGAVFVGPWLPLVPPHSVQEVPFDEPLETDEGWAKYNRHYWLRDYRSFLEFFLSECCTEPHSTKQIEDGIGWGLDTTAETLLVIEDAPCLATKQEVLTLCDRVRRPVLVLHGDEDAICPPGMGAALAEATGGTLVTLAGSGHMPNARDPVKVNLLIREFVESLS